MEFLDLDTIWRYFYLTYPFLKSTPSSGDCCPCQSLSRICDVSLWALGGRTGSSGGSQDPLHRRLQVPSICTCCACSVLTLDSRFDHASGNFASPELASLHDRSGRPLPLDELYLDTTFCSPLYKTFPTREEAQEEIWSLCKKWVTKGSPAWNMFSKKSPPPLGIRRVLSAFS